jgi:amidase
VHLPGAASGPLAGLRCGVKDLYHLAGQRTGFGHPLWLDSHPVPDTTAVAVQRLLDAGATVVGKTICDELCYSLNGVNPNYGTPLNANAPGCIPGGSSSGSASAVAGGLVDFSLGSDTGGSVRVPASYCGILGMRPTFDAVPLDGAVPFAPSYDTAGWFAATPELLRAVGRVLLADESPAPAAGPLLIATDAFERADPAAAAALRGTLGDIESAFAGSRTVTVAPDGLDAWMQSFRILQGAQIWATHRDWLASLGPAFSAGIHERFQWVSTITPAMVAQAEAHRAQITRRDGRAAAGRRRAGPAHHARRRAAAGHTGARARSLAQPRAGPAVHRRPRRAAAGQPAAGGGRWPAGRPVAGGRARQRPAVARAGLPPARRLAHRAGQGAGLIRCPTFRFPRSFTLPRSCP